MGFQFTIELYNQYITRFITMPACDTSRCIMGLKIVSAAPGNVEKGLPTHLGSILLYNLSGQLLCQMDCGEITKKRTAICSAVATKVLASPSSKILAILGAGVQAESHIWALRHLYQLTEIRIWNRTPSRSTRLADKLNCTVCTTVEEACQDADIICTVTGTKDPILHNHHIKPGAHVNLVGASSPFCREVFDDVMLNADVTLVADCRKAVLIESGDFINAGVTPHHEIGDLIAAGFTRNEQGITLYKNLGLGCQDLTSAHLVLQNYQKQTGQA